MVHASDTPQTMSFPTTAVILLTGFFVFMLGFTWAVMKRANKDYKATKAAVKPLRKAFWGSWISMMKFLLVCGVVAFVLAVWVVRDFKDLAEQPVPAQAPSAPTRK